MVALSFPVVPDITQGPVDTARRIGESVTFTCNATGVPLPSITWSSTSSSSINGFGTIDGTTRQSQITISGLQLDDFENYTCTATNQFGNDSVTALLQCKMIIYFIYCYCT